jgi:predicted N-acetyltransferase YhbS
MSLALEIRRLSQKDRCSDFCSGNDRLDEFFRQYAKQHEARRLSVTFVACVAEKIVGFVTTIPTSVPSFPLKAHVKGLSGYPAPVLLLARMATDNAFQGQGIGNQLLREAVFARALVLADEYASVGIYVDPKPEAVSFYQRYGFVVLQADAVPAPMFLPIGTVRSAMGPP